MDDTNFLAQNYPGFIECTPNLQQAFSKAFAVDVPKLYGMEHFVLVLSKLCVDRFEDIFILCTHGRGDGTAPLLRAMFEGLVNASYLQAYPDKSLDFTRYSIKFIQKVQRHIERLSGKTLTAEQKKAVEEAAKHFAGPDGKIPGPNADWTDATFVDRAADKNVDLAPLVVPAYYRQIEIAHSSLIHVASQLKIEDGQKFIFRGAEEASHQRIRENLLLSHLLAIKVLQLLHRTFGQEDLIDLIDLCDQERSTVWTRIMKEQAA